MGESQKREALQMGKSTIYDTIIIGGGPAGCSAALHLAYQKRSVLVLDRGTSPMHFHTNTIMNFASGTTYHEGRSLLRQLHGIAKAAGAEFKEANVVQVSGRYPEFCVRTDKSYRTYDVSEYQAKTLIFGTGTSRKHPKVNGLWRGWLPVANVGNAAFYCPDCEAPLCQDKDVLVVNAGTVGSALHVANSLSRFTKKIRILMTEDAYMPIEEQDLSKLDASPFQWIRGVIKEVQFPRPGKVQTIILEDGGKIRAQVFFVAYVAEARSDLAQQIGVEVDKRGNIITDHRGKTNIEGVWAAGDCRPITQQIAMAVGTANYAAVMCNQFLGNEYEVDQQFDHPDYRAPLHLD
ncbi:MAG: NAD(P)/FAD-dependent oxidoreductase [Candidatus Thorarchaeota archaeon]|nr:NAD(P)/FAD-dependent oxidoreductase [Candidatus Thorarchaeota archaeon]